MTDDAKYCETTDRAVQQSHLVQSLASKKIAAAIHAEANSIEPAPVVSISN